MTRIISILSGKGGVGKTTLTANLAAAFADFGISTLALDSNLTTPNLGLHLGIPLFPITLNDVLKGKAKLDEAIYHYPNGLRIIPAGIGMDALRGVDPRDLPSTLLDLLGSADIILLDSAAGLGREALAALEASDEVLLIGTPDLPSMTDVLKACQLGKRVGTKPIGIVVNRITGARHELTRSEIRALTGLSIIAEIPEDRSVPAAIAARQPVIHYRPGSAVSFAIRKLAAALAGLDYAPSIPWWKRLFRR